MTKQLTIGLLAGETSGDNLGAGLMRALITSAPADCEVHFVGVGGEHMAAAGLETLYPISELSVNGFKDPVLRLPSLIRLLKNIGDEMLRRRVDLFLGVDFNVFNFLLEGRLKKHGITTAHYVSPSVYAWRRGRTKRVAKVADMIFCLYPFEPPFYENTSVEAVFVGHPMADEIDPSSGNAEGRRQAREELELHEDATVVAVLPGSRSSEIELMLPAFVGAMQLIAAQIAEVQFVIPYPREDLLTRLEMHLNAAGIGSELKVKLVAGGARTVLRAADAGLVKSGTSTLEAMLLRRPMVVSYRLGPWSYQLARRLVRTPYIALPNILLGRARVPELLQDEGSAENLATTLLSELEKSRSDPHYFDDFEALHHDLRRDADATAARAVLRLLQLGSDRSDSSATR